MKISAIKNFSLIPLAGLAACTGQSDKQESQSERPNIIWIYADDHDQRAISVYSDKLIETPNIDRLANEGMLFENSFVTNSISAPCRAVLLTGKHSHLNGVRDNHMPFDGAQQTFPKLLQKAGYETAIIGKWHLHSTPTGFDYWHTLPGHGHYRDPQFVDNGDTIQIEGYLTDITTDVAIEYLENKRDKQKPFTLLLHNKAPHSPFMPAIRHLDMFKGDSMPVPATFFHDCKKRGTAACDNSLWMYDLYKNDALAKVYDKKGDSIVANKWLSWMYSKMNKEEQEKFDSTYLPENRELFRNKESMTDKEKALWSYQRYIKEYLRCIKAIDENVGRLLDYLDKSGLAENTIVFYSSDQGFYLGDFGWMDKRMMYEISMRTPLIARWPGKVEPRSTCSGMVQNLDIAETFLDIAGTQIPADMQGLSILPLLTSEKERLERDALYYHYYGSGNIYAHYGIRTKTQKLIHFYTLDEWEFYDLEKDPQELTNDIEKTQYQEDIKTLKIKLKALQKKYKDTSFVVTN